MFGAKKSTGLFGEDSSASTGMFGGSKQSSIFGGEKQTSMFGGEKQTSMFGGEKPSAVQSVIQKIPGFEEEPCCAKFCPKLTYQQRIIGYAACSVFGFILSIIGTLILIGGTSANNIRLFVIFYVMGAVIALCATGFLLGPRAQCTKMWLPIRRWSTAFYLLMLVVVLIVAVLKQNILLVLFLLVIEILAATWYSLSYIPFGRKITLAFLRRTGACFPCFYIYDEGKKVYDETFPQPTAVEKVTGTGKAANTNKSGGMFGGSKV